MPPPIDFRDHPEKYKEGDFPVYNKNQLMSCLPVSAKIYFGDIKKTLLDFFEDFPEDYKIGFISMDLDYYSSTKNGLEILNLGKQNIYLPSVPMYFDDVNNLDHNEYCGELLAIKEFNQNPNNYRKITKMTQLKDWRLFKHALWLDQMYFGHIFDSQYRTSQISILPGNKNAVILDNPYLDN